MDGIEWRGVCNNSFILHLHKISGEKNYDKEMKKERKWRGGGGGGSVADWI